MALGYGQISFNDIYNELNAYGGYTSSRSARAMASHAGFGQPDAASDFHGYTTPAPESQLYSVFFLGAYPNPYGGGYVCGDYSQESFFGAYTNLGRYVYSWGGGVSGNYTLDGGSTVYVISNGTVIYTDWCSVVY